MFVKNLNKNAAPFNTFTILEVVFLTFSPQLHVEDWHDLNLHTGIEQENENKEPHNSYCMLNKM